MIPQPKKEGSRVEVEEGKNDIVVWTVKDKEHTKIHIYFTLHSMLFVVIFTLQYTKQRTLAK